MNINIKSSVLYKTTSYFETSFQSNKLPEIDQILNENDDHFSFMLEKKSSIFIFV